METYEFQGKNTEEAVKAACKELNLSREDMEIEILEPGSAGIFGLVGARKARIRVTMAPAEEGAEAVAVAEAEAEAAMPLEQADEGRLLMTKEILEKLLELIPIEDVKVTGQMVNGAVMLNVEGDKTGLLIGRKGKTLDALQFLVNRIANKNLERKIRVTIDAESYRLRRQDSLAELAVRLGEKAKRSGKPVSTNLLNPHDRRIIHMALKNEDTLTTKSVGGEGVFKKVLILPRKNVGARSASGE